MTFVTNPDINEILRVPGYLYWKPTNLASEAGYGTLLGFSQSGIEFFPNYMYEEIRAEDTGVQILEKIYIGCAPRLRCILRNFNATMLARLLPGLAVTNTLKANNSLLTGAVISSSPNAEALIFVPQDTVNNPCLLFQRAAPNVTKSSQIRLSHSNYTTFDITFDALEKDSSVSYGVFYLGNISGAILA